MENYQFPSTYTAISGLLDDVDNSKQWNFELWHYCIKATIYCVNMCVDYINKLEMAFERDCVGASLDTANATTFLSKGHLSELIN